MRILVAIAHHGTKNREYLLRMLEVMRTFEHVVDVVVLTEETKQLPDDVEQVVGLPTDDPWSLPFAHRQLFADRKDHYDLFVYTEDDIDLKQQHLDAFIEIDPLLPDDRVLGFMRYERWPNGSLNYCTVHSHFRWDLGSAFRSDALSFARFTNEHAACYVLTRRQLTAAIASGGFLLAPHKGRYEMPESAATDVYTRCGFQKVHCLERMEDQLVHHMSDAYLGRMGVGDQLFRSYVDEMRGVAGDGKFSESFEPESRVDSTPMWDRHLYPVVPEQIEDLVPEPFSRVLTVGATTGDFEAALGELGHEVVALPVDSVFASGLRARGIAQTEAVPPTDRLMQESGPFDAILALNVVGHAPDPIRFLSALRAGVSPSGRIAVSSPDHRRYRIRNRVPGAPTTEIPTSYEEHGVHSTSVPVVRRWLNSAGWSVQEVQHRAAKRNDVVGKVGTRARVLGNWLMVVATPGQTHTAG